MHGFISRSNLLVNAEVDSMGGIVESGVGIGTKTSPRRAAIEKAQAELRLEYDVREERRRELEFLEKGGNPLDFKFGLTAPASVQSSSLADQLVGWFGTCEAKGSFASAASPRGDSIGSSHRLGATVACEPNSADNFDEENDLIESKGKPTYASRSDITPSEHSSQIDGSQNVRESEDSPIFRPKKAYIRRNRSKTNRDSAQSSSAVIGSHVGHNSSLPVRHGVVSNAVMHEAPCDTEMDGVNAATTNPTNGELFECAGKAEDGDGPEQLRESNPLNDDGNCTQTEGVVNSIAVTLKGLDSESSSVSVDGNGNIDSGFCTTMKNVDSIGQKISQKVPLELTANSKDEKVLEDANVADITESDPCIHDIRFSQSHQANGFTDKDEEETNKNQLSAQHEAKCKPCAEEIQPNQKTDSTLVAKQGSLDYSINKAECSCPENPQEPQNSSVENLTWNDISCSVPVPEVQPCDQSQTKVVGKAHEDQILEEAQNIKAKRKIIEELSLHSLPKEYRRKSHWDSVLEEMTWMANDFAQERIWKKTAAAQFCYQAAFACRLRLEEQEKHGRDRVVAKTMAKAVTDFWHSAALLVGENGNCSGLDSCEHATATSENANGNSNAKVGNGSHDKEHLGKNIKLVQEYAIRFLQHNSSVIPVVKEASSGTLQRAIMDIPQMTYKNQHTEEDLFYPVAPGAMEAYSKSIERYMVMCERAGKHMQEVDTSMYDAVTEFEYQENDYEEDEGENMYYLPGAFEGHKASKFAQKKQKNPKLYTPRSYEVGDDFLYGRHKESRIGIPQSAARRPPNGLGVCPIPTKRVRTASRQRVVGPFSSGAGGIMPIPRRTDASSGDTNSFQDDQSSLNCGSFIPKGLEVESGMDYDKHSAFDSAEPITKPKKKKKTKHQGTTYDQRWQVDYSMQTEQRGHYKRRLENHQFDLNGNSGPVGPHGKKPKINQQTFDNSFENTTPMSGSVASPVGSQMSNMSNPNKLFKLIGGRDRGRKTKSLKMPSGQTWSGSPWSLFEDQALVVLVHDMGPNWELVSDAINSTLHFKCIFRKSKECKERHGSLMEKSCGDGADTEDSGSSQLYPSTLPGIPKGGAWQLFQQLRGPMEEDTIKTHFETIILIGQQLHGRKKQEPKQLVPIHSSHLATLSQVIPNNVNGGVLTPLDLCHMVASSPDVFSLGYQGPHTGGLPLPNQGAVQSMLPSSSTNSLLQGSPSMGLGGNLASPSAQLSGPVRDGKYGIPRTSLPIDEQHIIQQYNHMLSNRNIQQPGMPVPGTFSGNDRGGRMLPGGNGMVMPGMSRSMSMPRPGVQGVSSSSMLNSGSMAASNMVGMPSSMSIHSGVSAGQGNSSLRPRDALHMVRPGQNPEHHRQMMSSEMQMQVPHANSGGVPTFGGLSAALPSQSASSHPTYPVNHQQHSNVPSNSHHPHLQGSAHPGSTEQQAFAVRLARERQLQQRMLQRQQQQHQQFPASGASFSHVSTQSQLPISSALQNSSQTKLQAASQPVSLPPVKPPSPLTRVTAQQQKKHQLPHHRHGQAAQSGGGGMVNQGGKQRQRQAQQVQQSDRHHLPQRQPSQSQQQAKHLKGVGRGNLLMQQNLPVDSSNPNGLSGNPGSQLEEGEQAAHLIQGQGFPAQSFKPIVPPSAQSHEQQKLYSKSIPGLPKQVQQMHSHPDNDNTTQTSAVISASTVPTSNQGIPPPVIQSPNHQQLKVHSHPPIKLVNHTQPTIHRATSQDHVTNSDPVTKTQSDQSQVGQQMASSTSPMSATSGIPPICVKSTNAVPVASSAGSAEWKTSESLSDMVIPNPQLGPIASFMTNSSGNEADAGQGPGLKQPSNTLASHGSLQPKQQQKLQTTSPNQVLLPKNPQVQAAQSNTFTRSSNSSLE